MKRRTFLRAGTAAIGLPYGLAAASTFGAAAADYGTRGTIAVEENRVRFFTESVSKPIRLMVVADTHLFIDDERGRPYQKYSCRMAAAYNRTKHFQTGEDTNPEASFVRVLERA
ncbi:MAG: hypothetical protein KDA61_00585, partial [Planctomycetales bacterium]|nr:hypothetical protein [Planctomycetales bacterium]